MFEIHIKHFSGKTCETCEDQVCKYAGVYTNIPLAAIAGILFLETERAKATSIDSTIRFEILPERQ